MEDEKELKFYLAYLGLFLLSAVLAVFSALFAAHNPVGWLLISLVSPLLPLAGVDPAGLPSGSDVRLLIINAVWPITLVPMQMVTMLLLKWRVWQFLLLWFGFNLMITLVAHIIDLGL